MKKYLFLILSMCGLNLLLGQTANFQWAKQLGGTTLNNKGQSVTSDASGNVYTTGYFEGTVDFDPNVGVFNLTALGGEDIFISKLDASGNFVWAKQMGGISYDQGYSIIIDASGNIYTTGSFQGTADFDPSGGTFTLTSSGGWDIFISKLDASGNFIWAKNMGGTSPDYGQSLATDIVGNVYTTGYFMGTSDFDPSASTFNLISTGSYEIFISKLNSSGNFVWAKQIGSIGADYGRSIFADASGNIYTTGEFQGPADFDPGVGTFTLTSVGGNDIFVSKLDAAGNFVWAKQMGGFQWDSGYGIAVDVSGNVYTSGYFFGSVDFDPGAGTYILNSNGQEDIFVSKLDASGNFVWTYQMGGASGDVAYSIALDGTGNVYTTGYFMGTASFGTNTFTSSAISDIFVSKIDPSGNFVWAKQIGGNTSDFAYSITVDVPGNVYTTGYFGGTCDFDPSVGIYTLTTGGIDVFVHKMSQGPVNINENSFQNNFNVFPNPNNGSFKLQIDSEIEKGELILINSLGQKVHEQKTIRGENNIITRNLASGLYTCVILQDKIQISNGKLAIE